MRTFLFLSLAFISVSFHRTNERPDDIIRRKIENANFKAIEAFGEPIYCVNTLKQFYLNRSFEPVWKSTSITQLLSEIQKADMEGLTPSDYHLETLLTESSGQFKSALSKADRDLLLTDAFLLYTSHLLSGKVNPQTINAEWHVARREGDPVALLEQAISSGNITKTIQETMPKHSVYQSLKKALETYNTIEVNTWPIIPDGPTIKKGMEDERIPKIRERLFVLGDLNDMSTNNLLLYDEKLYAAVQQFQARHGLENEGNIGVRTIASLNVTVENRINQIKANMERWRWLSQEFGDYYIEVNIANFELKVFKNGKMERSHKVITGKPYRKTPVFSSKMQYLVFNPTWTIPPGILNADVLPGVRKDVSYLEKKKLTVLDNQGNPVNTLEIDWNNKEVENYTYCQPPGPDNALGAVKLMFPNKFHVYLHDTPAKELFEKTERAFSSGCIRVHEALSFAEYLLNDPVNWSKEKIDKVVATNKSQTVQLKEQPNVHLLYWTAWTNTNNIVQFRHDVYDRDKLLIEELMKQPPMLIINNN